MATSNKFILIFWLSTYICASWAAAPSDSSCTPDPLGLRVQLDGNVEVFYATQRSFLGGDDEQSRREAHNDARLKAVALLKEADKTPKTESGSLRGVRATNICSSSGYVYVTVAVDQKGFDAATAMIEKLKSSAAVEKQKTIIDQDDDDEFEKFMKEPIFEMK